MKASTIVVLIAIGFAATLALLETWVLYGRGSDEWIATDVQTVIDEQLPLGNSPLEVAVESHWVSVEGDLSAESGTKLVKAIGDIPGVYRLVSHLHSVNEDALGELTQTFNAEPSNIPVTYTLEAPGTVILGGRVDDETVRARLVSTFASISGVQGVVESWKDDVAERIEADIRGVLKQHNIYFDHNLSTIRAESMLAIKGIAEVLRKYPDELIRIEGHTDSVDSEAYNQGLSEARAGAVLDALSDAGIARSRLASVGYGETRPIANNALVEGRAENRRTEFRVIESGE